MQEAVTQENKIYTAIYGADQASERPPVVLIRGLGRAVEHWHGFEELVATKYPTIIFDNKGMGRSDQGLTLSVTIADFAAHLIEVLDHWNIKKAHVVGISLGGMIAIESARRFSERILSYCAINSSANYRVGMRLSLSGIYEFAKFGFTGGRSEDSLYDVMVASTNQQKKQEALKSWDAIRGKYGVQGFNALCQLKAAFFFGASKDWENIQLPGLIVVGQKDRLVPSSNSTYLASKLPNAELVEIAEAGHELLMDAASEFLEYYERFIHSIKEPQNP